MAELSGRVALVTGAAGGLGRLAAHRLAEMGARIAVVDIDADGAAATASEVAVQHGVPNLAIAIDVSSSAAVEEMRAAVERELGPVNVLVNGAGILMLGSILDVTEEEWDLMMAVNLKSVFLVTRAVLPGMMETDYGRIINISSLAGKVGGVMAGIHYGTSKGALLSFTKALARDVGRHGITANCVCPYTAETEMISKFSDQQVDSMRDMNPMRRLARPEEVAAAIVFLASPGASFINAEMLDVDGGFTAD